MSMLGADVAGLRELSRKFAESARTLETLSTGLLRQVDLSTWEGQDAEGFKDAWRSTHTPKLTLTASALTAAATALTKHADEQEAASEPGGTSGQGGQQCTPGVTWLDKLTAAGTLTRRLISFGSRALKAGRMAIPAVGFFNAMRVAATSPAAASAMTFMGREMVDIVTKPGALVSRLGPVAKFIGPLGGAVALGAGIHQMLNPAHDGWRGWGDRVIGGGFSAISGAATLAVFLTPAGPVAAAVAIGFGLVSAAWNLGNAIYDNWDTITAKTGEICSAVADGAKAVGGAVVDGAKAVGGAIVDGAKVVGNVISDAAGAVSGFFKGIFG